MDEEQRQHFEELLQICQRRLRVLEKQAALHGLDTPPQVQIEIAEIQKDISRIEAQLTSNRATRKRANAQTTRDNFSNRRWIWITAAIIIVLLFLFGFYFLLRGTRLFTILKSQILSEISTPGPTIVAATISTTIPTVQSTVSPNPLPKGFLPLEETIFGRFDPSVPADVRLEIGRAYRYTGERTGRYCRTEFPPDGLIWVLCIHIGEPEPTPISLTPTTRLSRPTLRPTLTYKVDVVKISLDDLKSLPGCDSPVRDNNACFVGPSHLDMKIITVDPNIVTPFSIDARLASIFTNRTRIIVVADDSGLPIVTTGDNLFTPEAGIYYEVVVAKVQSN